MKAPETLEELRSLKGFDKCIGYIEHEKELRLRKEARKKEYQRLQMQEYRRKKRCHTN
jgi:hypothetical protein